MEISAFRGFRYDPEAVGGLDRVVALPYDKITPERAAGYRAASPWNIVRVIRNEDHADAASALRDWIGSGVLRQDARPALYPYDIDYELDGRRLVRQGLVARVRLEELGKGHIIPHEHTFAHVRKERLGLLQATRTHFGQVFLVYDHEPPLAGGAWDEVRARPPAAEALAAPEDGILGATRHRLWRIDEPELVRAIGDALRDVRAVIADGHHRYGMSLEFSRRDPAEGARWVMATLVSARQEGLSILPSHRLLRRESGLVAEEIVRQAASNFELIGPDRCGSVAVPSGVPVFKLIRPGRPDALLALRGREALNPDEAPGKPLAWRRLDLSVLHGLILDPLARGQEEPFAYCRTEREAREAVQRGLASAAILVRPCSFRDVLDVTAAGEVMPHKSTDFYPKLLSGLVLYSLDHP